MANIYKSIPGTLIKQQVKQPAFLTVEGLALGDVALATSFRVDRAQDVQHVKTLSRDIYSYAFGESIGKIQIGGMLFLATCSGKSATSISDINEFYSNNNIYTKGSSLTCTIGSGTSFKCYLENISVSIEASAYNSGSFGLGFSVLSSDDKGAGGKTNGGLKIGKTTAASLL